ncbi:hypothetical protein C0J52_19913 [Blattella germanica]|nr:hypothetical protein C0J52_19913 [Blattella germanica]
MHGRFTMDETRDTETTQNSISENFTSTHRLQGILFDVQMLYQQILRKIKVHKR